MKSNSLERNQKLRTAGTYLFFIIGSIVMIFPFIWMLLTSFKTVAESMQIPPDFFPAQWIIDNFKDAMASLPFGALYKNTILLIFWRVVCAVAFSSMAGYAFAKLNFKGKNFLFSLVLVQMMLPSQIFITPQYQMLAKMGLTNTIFALVFPGLVSAFGTFFLRQAYMGIPDEISEAAYLDGCNQWQTFVKVMVPLTTSSMAALAVFTAVFAYGDLMWPLIANTDLKMMTLSSGLATLRGQFNTNFPVMMAGSLLAMIPMVVLYLFFQKQFIEGVAMTGGK
ncbi:MAG: carbohydrate ABC transporter permease [Lachnospiraceae bacterium]|uniref:carbohydrate ABC transporter permease n=1 Tax=Candidatus Merdisoma sp. JLR.KK011 TaxID=3114299 RepID=UPI0014340378|nr:carbohydrate ABC transporter permease [Lachnospiraceae bacterium]MCI8862242.1 carbohydrate ABC transporter permease [Lachnospiraceae bacterium]MCI9478181.1 carbohydrate ABC transporter permease [Lachnospiraceae bacterium]MCI9623533.1 carbohydrate ABC transporter permease [Lachnospiraceae bacterium]GFI10239.1 L-arabinose transport system permease protein AraQ [Lachnospiraceae bacterium]